MIRLKKLLDNFNSAQRGTRNNDEDRVMSKWQCVVCGLIYDEAQGWPEDGIAAGTKWQDVPEDWVCPDCGVGKADFEMIEIA